MAEILLFHHALGRTDGVVAFADALRADGHRVTVPDLYDGLVFDSIDEGVAHAERLGMDEVIARGVAAAEALPPDLVYAGFSLGTLPAQRLAQTRPGARAALLFHGGEPLETFDAGWPSGCPLQLHVARADPWCDLEAAEELARAVEQAELFVYPGDAHLFTDAGFDEYDADAAALVLERTRALLDRLD